MYSSLRYGRRCGRFRSAARMSLEHAGRSEFTQFVADHVFGHEQLGEVFATMNQERMPDEVRNDRAIARPSLDRLTTSGALLLFDFAQQALIDIRAFFNRTSHANTSKFGTVYFIKATVIVQFIRLLC